MIRLDRVVLAAAEEEKPIRLISGKRRRSSKA
jgi:hypothetical protein